VEWVPKPKAHCVQHNEETSHHISGTRYAKAKRALSGATCNLSVIVTTYNNGQFIERWQSPRLFYQPTAAIGMAAVIESAI